MSVVLSGAGDANYIEQILTEYLVYFNNLINAYILGSFHLMIPNLHSNHSKSIVQCKMIPKWDTVSNTR